MNDTALSHDDRGRMEAVQKLVRDGVASIAPLVELLAEPNWVIRRAVVSALARLGTPAVESLARVIDDRQSTETKLAAAVEALVTSGGDVESCLLARAKGPRPFAECCDIAQIFGRRKSREAIPLLTRWSTHEDDNVAVAAIEALGRIGGAMVVEPLIEVVKRRYFFRTFPVIAVLGQARDQRVVEPLSLLIDDPLYAVEAIAALGATGEPTAVTVLAHALTSASDDVVKAAACALSHLYSSDSAMRETVTNAVRSTGHASARGLIHALESADAQDKTAIARVLGWTRDPSTTSVLLGLLASDETVALEAARALEWLGAEVDTSLRAALLDAGSANRRVLIPLLGPRKSATPELVECLRDTDPLVRAQAAEWLGRRGDASIVASLFALIGDADAHVAQAALGAIQSLGSDETKRQSLLMASSTHLPTRRAALRLLSYFAYPEALDVLITAIDDEDGRLRDAAAGGLALLENPRATAALFSLARREPAAARATAMRALGTGIHSPEIIKVLEGGLKDSDAWVRYYACQALGKLHAAPISDAIVSMFEDPAGQVRVAALEAVAHIGGPRAFTLLEQASHSNDPDMRRAALLGLGTLRRPEALAILLEATHAQDPVTRLVALSVLGEASGPDVIAALIRAGSDEDDRVRAAAIGLMANRSAPQIVTWLVEQLASDEMQARAASALTAHPDNRIEALLSALETADEKRAARVTAVLVTMGTPASAAALESALVMQNVEARRAAARALARIATPSALAALGMARADADDEVRRIALGS